MLSYSERYRTARSVFGIVEFVSWLLIGLGLLAAIVGLSATVNSNQQLPIAAGAGLVYGASFVVYGVFSIAFVQVGRAILDTAETNSEILRIVQVALSLQSSESHSPRTETTLDVLKSAGKGSSISSDDQFLAIEISPPPSDSPYDELPYRGLSIRHYTAQGEYWVGSRGFNSVSAAKAHIDERLGPS